MNNFKNNKIKQKALTFDDVLLIPQKSNIVPKDVLLTTKLTKNLNLNINLHIFKAY